MTTGQGCVSGGTQVGAVKPLLFVFPWRVEYSGDPNNASASHTDRNGACFTVVQSPPPSSVNQIPTLSEWVMIVLAGFVALVGVAQLHKRKRVGRPVF